MIIFRLVFNVSRDVALLTSAPPSHTDTEAVTPEPRGFESSLKFHRRGAVVTRKQDEGGGRLKSATTELRDPGSHSNMESLPAAAAADEEEEEEEVWHLSVASSVTLQQTGAASPSSHSSGFHNAPLERRLPQRLPHSHPRTRRPRRTVLLPDLFFPLSLSPRLPLSPSHPLTLSSSPPLTLSPSHPLSPSPGSRCTDHGSFHFATHETSLASSSRRLNCVPDWSRGLGACQGLQASRPPLSCQDQQAGPVTRVRPHGSLKGRETTKPRLELITGTFPRLGSGAAAQADEGETTKHLASDTDSQVPGSQIIGWRDVSSCDLLTLYYDSAALLLLLLTHVSPCSSSSSHTFLPAPHHHLLPAPPPHHTRFSLLLIIIFSLLLLLITHVSPCSSSSSSPCSSSSSHTFLPAPHHHLLPAPPPHHTRFSLLLIIFSLLLLLIRHVSLLLIIIFSLLLLLITHVSPCSSSSSSPCSSSSSHSTTTHRIQGEAAGNISSTAPPHHQKCFSLLLILIFSLLLLLIRYVPPCSSSSSSPFSSSSSFPCSSS
ncbi:unnamed protein product [Pleuronectes platessa]|uniref:Uncharacterized protein n=1 Tax=Pleuronectes platessa TaxID=8262 RepID=A0A9N7YP35_PLEPL|nr:unnamed protein product [Pleuronectes platessa]